MWVRVLFLIAVFSTWCLGTASRAADSDLAIVHGPYLSDVSESAAIINWNTSREAYTAVEWQVDDGAWRTVMASRDGLVITGTRHSVTLVGLKPGQRISYRIVAKPILYYGSNNVNYGSSVTSTTYAFETLNRARKGFTAYFFNDLHSDIDRLKTLFEQVQLQPGDLVFFNGDMVDHMVDEQVLLRLIDFCAERFAAQFPLYYVRGNHETRGSAAPMVQARFPTFGGKTFYTVEHGGAQFIVLDSGEDKEDSHKEYSGLADFDALRDQIETPWLRQLVTTPTAAPTKFKVAVFHIPIFGGARWHSEQQIAQLWRPLFNQAGLDLEMSGHTHVRTWLPQDYIWRHFPIMIGGTHSFAKLTFDERSINLDVIDISGRLLDHHKVKAKL
jgi:predicted phosphodiesterase